MKKIIKKGLKVRTWIGVSGSP